MKKVLSMLLALAMVLTMATFPAFAEEPAQINVAAVTSKLTPASGYTLLGVIDGKGVGDPGAGNANYFRANEKPTPSGTKGDAPNDKNFHVVVDFSVPHNVTGLRANWGGKYAEGIALWASNDQVTWTEIADLAPTTQTSNNTVSHEGYYRYVKVEAYKIKENNNDPACGELTFYGTTSPDYAKVTGITADNITTSGGGFYSSTSLGITPDKASLVDGDVSNSTVNTFTFSWSGTAKTIEVTLPEATTLSTLVLYWGNTKGADGYWNVRPAKTYEIFLAGADGVYGEVAYSHNDTTLTGTPGGTNRNDVVTFDTPVEGVKKIKVVVSNYYNDGCLAIRELEIFKYTKEVVKIPTTYTVNYVDTEGNPVSTPKTVDSKFVGNTVTEEAIKVAGYKCTEEPKTITLVEGTNEIVFTYEAATNVTYTVNYVDAAGNPIADAKTVTAYEGDTVLEEAPVIDGYFIADVTTSGSTNYLVCAKSIVLDPNGTNEITFTYKKVIDPSAISAKYAPGVSTSGGNASDWAALINGKFDRTTQYAPVGSAYDPATSPVIFTYSYDKLTRFDKLSIISNGNRPIEIKVYATLDGVEWNEVFHDENVRDDEIKFKRVKEDGTTSGDMFLSEIDLGGVDAIQIKVEIVSCTSGQWCGIYEMFTEGNEVETLTLDKATIVDNHGFGWATATMEGSAATLFDGEAATNTKGFFCHSYWDESIGKGEDKVVLGVRPARPADYYFVVDLGALYNIDTLLIQGGSSDWNYAAPMGYNVYFAGVDGKFSTTPDYTVMKHATDVGESLTSATKVRTDLFASDSENVRYIKIEFTAATRRPVIGEISIYGEAVNLTTAPEKAGASLGGQIRLPDESLTAGLRFGATIMKGVVNADGVDYDFDALAAKGAEIGMFMLPKDMLGGQTLTQYLANGVQNALKVPAKRILSENDASVTFTAVLVDIPESAYDRDIVAVPYLKVGDNYVYYAEMTKSYKGVATAVADSYEAGEVALTNDQITLINEITGKNIPLVYTVVDSVSLSGFVAPEAGDSASKDLSVTADKGYAFKYVIWYDSTGTNQFTGTFAAGTTYVAKFELEAEDGYEFAADLGATVNDGDVAVDSVSVGNKYRANDSATVVVTVTLP